MTAENILKDRSTCKTVHTYADKVCGVYLLTHVDSGKIYVGYSIDLYDAVNTSKNKLKRGCHDCKELQTKYCKNNNIDFLITLTSTLEEAISLKQDILNKYLSSKKLFNVSPSAFTPAKGIPKNKQWKQLVKEKLNQAVSVQGKVYSSFTQAGKALGLSQPSVSYRVNSPNYEDWFKL